jgi:dienelactone hydrolase
VENTGGPEGIWNLKNWYLHTEDPFVLTPLSAHIKKARSSAESYRGYLRNEQGGRDFLDHIEWNKNTGSLSFRRHAYAENMSFWEWYRGRIVEGIFVGRFSHNTHSPQYPSQNSNYVNHVVGWNSCYFDSEIVPRVYDIVLDADYRGLHGAQCRGILRIDRANNDSNFIGRMKIYATGLGNMWNIAGEELEYDLTIIHWDGKNIEFIRQDNRPQHNWIQFFRGKVDNQIISGRFTHEPGVADDLLWRGSRAQILTYGLVEKDHVYRKVWQERTRRQLMHIIMAGNPPPVKRVASFSPSREPIDSRIPQRDDDALEWPQKYALREIWFEYTLPDMHDGPDITRHSHAWLASPMEFESSNKKFPAVIALNGHYGSAWDVLQPNSRHSCGDIYWYGDSFARRGYVVLAVDISHRNDSPLYGPKSPLFGPFILDSGDDPLHGNHEHPSIKSISLESSDWEETGERVWDVMCALDYLMTLPYVDTSHILATGLSIGAEIATIVGALDPRISIVIASGWTPDSGVFYLTGHKCSNWVYANNLEYIDTSDYHALIAPRPIVIQTGKQDHVWSITYPYYAADKTVARRSRVAYGVAKDKLIHYLHCGEHEYHIGDRNISETANSESNLRIPASTEPESHGSLSWQTDGKTKPLQGTIFDLISKLKP